MGAGGNNDSPNQVRAPQGWRWGCGRQAPGLTAGKRTYGITPVEENRPDDLKVTFCLKITLLWDSTQTLPSKSADVLASVTHRDINVAAKTGNKHPSPALWDTVGRKRDVLSCCQAGVSNVIYYVKSKEHNCV